MSNKPNKNKNSFSVLNAFRSLSNIIRSSYLLSSIIPGYLWMKSITSKALYPCSYNNWDKSSILMYSSRVGGQCVFWLTSSPPSSEHPSSRSKKLGWICINVSSAYRCQFLVRIINSGSTPQEISGNFYLETGEWRR